MSPRISLVRVVVCSSLLFGVPFSAAEPEPVESPAATVTALFGNWWELSQLDLDALDAATAEMVVQRSVLPNTDDNAAVHYLRALLSGPEFERDLVNEAGTTPLLDLLPKLRDGAFDTALRPIDARQQSLRSALVASHCDWSPASEAGVATLLPELGPMRSFGRGQVLLAEWHLAHERPWSALHCYRDALAMARDVGDGPYLIFALVGISMESLVLDRIEQAAPVLIEQGIEPARLASVVGRRYRDGANATRAVSSERLWMSSFGAMESASITSAPTFWSRCAEIYNDLFAQESADAIDGPGLRRLAIESGFIGEQDADDLPLLIGRVLNELEYMNAVLDRLLSAWDLPSAEFAAFDESLSREIDANRESHPLAAAMLPSVGRAQHSVKAVERNRAALNIVLAIAAEHEARGRWPADMAELRSWRPDLNVVDPLAGGSFTMSAEGASVTISWTLTEAEREREGAKTGVTITLP